MFLLGSSKLYQTQVTRWRASGLYLRQQEGCWGCLSALQATLRGKARPG